MSGRSETCPLRARELGSRLDAQASRPSPPKSFRIAFPWYAAALAHMHGPGTAQLRERLKLRLHRARSPGDSTRIVPDIGPILADARMFRYVIESLANYFRDHVIDAVATVEASGFIVAAPLALDLSAALIPIRKLDRNRLRRAGQKADRSDSLPFELRCDSIAPGQRILLADDVLATGTTMRACAQLVQQRQAIVAGCAFLVELASFQGRRNLSGFDLFSLLVLD